MRITWIKNSDEEIKKSMMKALGIESLDELFNDIPEELRLKRYLNVGFNLEGLSEYEILRILSSRGKNLANYVVPPFAGIEVCYHFIPSVVKELMYRNEFYTAYTPYAAEINQGLLQALFEYQSLMAELYGVDVVNASMYDGTTALAEAVRMALRITKRRKVLVSRGLTPIKRRVLKTWLYGLGVKIESLELDEQGFTSINDMATKLDSDTAAIVIEIPNVFGVIDAKIEEYSELCRSRGALLIVFANPLSLGLIKPPGELGADIVVGEGQPLGLGLFYGGSTLGILGTKRDLKYVRQLPGRLVGMTVTEDCSDIGYTLVLQTREQHIRRERATSNITTNSALMALVAAMYVSWLGGEGLKRLAKSIATRTIYLANELAKVEGLEVLYGKSPRFLKVVVKVSKLSVDEVIKRAREKGLLCGSNLGRYDPWLEGLMSICVTEVHSKKDIDYLIAVLREVMK